MYCKLREYIHGYIGEKFIYPPVNNMAKLYQRFIDDVFIIWKGTLDQLLEFKQRINEIYLSIKFDFNFSNKVFNRNCCIQNTDRET